MMLLGGGGLTGGFISGWVAHAMGLRRTMLLCFSICFAMAFVLFKLNHSFTGIAYPEIAVLANRDVFVYTTSTTPVPIIRNEELILIYAEANIQQSDIADAVIALNIIRNAHNLGNYAGAVTQPALLTEMLNQRRYSLYCEGHRWIDIRRYNLLNTLPIDRVGDDVWGEFPIPVSEQQ